MSKKSIKDELLDALAQPGPQEAARLVSSRREEQISGNPSRETEERLAEVESTDDENTDLFDWCQKLIARGIPIVYYIKKAGKYVSTLSPPLNWDKIRQLYGPGHYLVIAKNERTMAFIKQRTEVLDELPEEADASSGDPSFSFGAPQTSGSDLSPIFAMMQRQDEQRAQQVREDRERDELRRREDRDREAQDRREAAASRDKLFQAALALAPTLLGVFKPHKDEKSEALIEIMRENQRTAQAQTEKMMDKFERLLTHPAKPETSALDLIKQLNDARKDGREEMKEMLEMVEDKANDRAQELAQSGGGEDSTLALVLKSLGPALGALISQKAVPGEVPALEADPVQSVETVQATPVVAPPPAPLSEDQKSQAEILKVLIPFFAEQFARMQQKRKIDPAAAARESLGLLKAKGFSQDRVIRLFSKNTLFGVLRSYNLPKEYDPWFNSYYEAISTRDVPPPAKNNVEPLSAKRGVRGSRNDVKQSDASLGFVPASKAPEPEVKAVSDGSGVLAAGPRGISGAGAPAGANPEGSQQLST